MSDYDTEYEGDLQGLAQDIDETEVTTDDAPPSVGSEAPTPPAASTATPRTPAGEGEVTIVAFAKEKEVAPQSMYGACKSNPGLKAAKVDRGEGVTPREVLNRELAEAAWAELVDKRAAKAAAAATADEVEAVEA